MNRVMTTQQIKRGLQNIKKAQLQVLKELKGDSFYLQQNQLRLKSNHNFLTTFSFSSLNNPGQYQPTVSDQDKLAYEQQMNLKQLQQYRERRSIMTNVSSGKSRQFDSIQKRAPESIQKKASKSIQKKASDSLQKMREQFSLQREQLNKKFHQIASKLNTLQKQSQFSKIQKSSNEQQMSQMEHKIKSLENQNHRLNSIIQQKSQSIIQLQISQSKLHRQIELKANQKIILQAQTNLLNRENFKLTQTLTQMTNQNKKYQVQVNELITKLNQHQFHKQQLHQQQTHMKQLHNQKPNKQQLNQEAKIKKNANQSSFGIQLMINELKSISSSHDFIFNKLKQSLTTLQISIIQKQSQIQSSFARLLQYFQNIANHNHNHFQDHSFLNRQKKNFPESRRKLISVSDSRVQDRQELEYFVKQIQTNSLRRQMRQLIEQNEALRVKLKELASQLASQKQQLNTRTRTDYPKHMSQSTRLMSFELQQMREQVQKLKKYRSKQREEQQQQQQQINRYKSRMRLLQSKIEQKQQKLIESSTYCYGLEKKLQSKDIQISELNSIITNINLKLQSNSYDSNQLNTLRYQFQKLQQTNSSIQTQNQSLKTINQGLQIKLNNLTNQKNQYQVHFKQINQLLQGQINKKNLLAQELQHKQSSIQHLNKQIEKLKLSLKKNQELAINQLKRYQHLLQENNQEIIQLRKEIEQLYKKVRQSQQIQFLHDKLKAQYKQLTRKSTRMSQTLGHLWLVKEAEYQNINQVLRMVAPHKRSGHSQKRTENQSDIY